MKPYTTKTGAKQFKPALDDLMAVVGEGTAGFCLACGQEQQGVEPDARKYQCAACKAPKVYGAEELVMMRLYHE